MKSKLILATFNSGSTYIQRALTFWIHELQDSRVCNPHELLNGIGWHDGHLVKQWMDVNAQSVGDLVDILTTNTQPIVARLAYDHYLLRQDQQDFGRLFDFLNTNFDTYYSRRDNLFDYGMCYSVRRQTARLPEKQMNNVYSPKERQTLYSDELMFTVVADDVVEQSRKYQDYVNWVQQHFSNARPISYEETEQDIDTVLQRITGTDGSIKDKYGISISEYTLIQYERSKGSQKLFAPEQYDLADVMEQRLLDLCEQKIMLDPIPIKSTTLTDKMSKVSNFDECVSKFNQWAQDSGIETIDSNWLDDQTKRTQVLYRGL